jgi:hypothetical protein
MNDAGTAEIPYLHADSAQLRAEDPPRAIDLALTPLARVRLRMFGIDEEEASLERPGFSAIDERTREHLEVVGRWFARGYRAGLAEPRLDLLSERLESSPAEFRGFAYEGAGTALTVLDSLIPTKHRLLAFVRGPALAHAWILPIGYGWARMRMGRPPRRPPAVFEPMQGWLAMDGAGFHEGFNRPQRAFERQWRPRRLSAEAARVFDQGLGRSLWFLKGGDVEAIGLTIVRFPQARRGDLWSGLASAATYAGGVSDDVLQALRDTAGRDRTEVAVGAALAAKARLLGGNPTSHTERACLILCGAGAVATARVTDAAQEGLALGAAASPYERWRERIGELLELSG